MAEILVPHGDVIIGVGQNIKKGQSLEEIARNPWRLGRLSMIEGDALAVARQEYGVAQRFVLAGNTPTESEAEGLKAYLNQEHGIPEEVGGVPTFHTEHNSFDTSSNAEEASNIVASNGFNKPVLIIPKVQLVRMTGFMELEHRRRGINFTRKDAMMAEYFYVNNSMLQDTPLHRAEQIRALYSEAGMRYERVREFVYDLIRRTVDPDGTRLARRAAGAFRKLPKNHDNT